MKGGAALDSAFWEQQTEALAKKGYRVLALAFKETDQTHISFGDVQGGMTLLGCVGMIDPPRPEAIQAVRSAAKPVSA
jgi:magnesium-transporting ATPase (P-type)